MTDKLIIIQQNIRSLRKNFDLFSVELSTYNELPDIIVLSEIWINYNETDFYKLPDYNVYFNCNENYRAGGIAVYLKNTCCNVNIINLKCESADVLMLSFDFKRVQFHIISIYRLLAYSIDFFINEFNDHFKNDNGVFKNTRNLIWIGDLNINILEDMVSAIDNYNTLMAANGLECMIREPTRITEQSKTCIDHVFLRLVCKRSILVNTAVIHKGITDHSMIRLEFQFVDCGRGSSDLGSPCSTSTDIYHRIDKAKFKQLIAQVDWSDVFIQSDASSAFDSFFEIFKSLMSQSKIDIIKKGKIKKLKPWISDNICLKIKKRNHIFKLVRNHPLNENIKNYYKNYRNKLHNEIKLAKSKFYKRKFDKCQGNSKETWKILNELTGQNKQTNNKEIKLEINTTIVNDPQVVADEFNDFFLNIVNNLELNDTISDGFLSLEYRQHFPIRYEMNSMFIDPVLPQDLMLIINSLKNNSPGIDGIDSSLIKENAGTLLNVLLYIINFSFETGVFPEKLKKAVVIPIYKSSSPNNCSNYRPISLLSCFSKIIEKIMKQKLLKFFNSVKFFSSNQFGFRAGFNTEHALLNFMTNVYDGINENKKVSGLFLDIKKAFDTVDHNILLNKLYAYGVRGVVHKWFRSYLIGRQQCVKVDSVLSKMGVIMHGVPQGSVLGAILFIIYINDLCNAKLEGNLTSFADDTALCYTAGSWDLVQVAMNKDLESLQWWFTANHMLLSPEKTKFINFSLRGDIHYINPIKYMCAECLQNGGLCRVNKCTVVNRTNNIKYLGLYLDSEVGWKEHIIKLKGKINNVLRYFYFLRDLSNDQILRTLYFSLVQSRLEYGIVFWGNTFDSYLNPIYLQQKHLIRLISFKNRFEQSRPLFINLKILPLKYLYVYKVLKLFYIKSGNIPQHENEYRRKLRNAKDLPIKKPNNSFFMTTFNYIAPKIYNRLPENIKFMADKNSFLKNIKFWLFLLDNVESLFEIPK